MKTVKSTKYRWPSLVSSDQLQGILSSFLMSSATSDKHLSQEKFSIAVDLEDFSKSLFCSCKTFLWSLTLTDSCYSLAG